MSKKKSLYVIIVILLIVAGFVGYKVYDHNQWKPVTLVVDQFLDNYSKGNEEMAQYVLDEGNSNPGPCLEYSEFVKDFFTYEIKGHHKADNRYVVDVKITTIDIPKILDGNSELYEGLLFQSDRDAFIKELRAIKEKPMHQVNVSLALEPFDDTYYIVVDDDVLSALSGGFYLYQPAKAENE